MSNMNDFERAINSDINRYSTKLEIDYYLSEEERKELRKKIDKLVGKRDNLRRIVDLKLEVL